MEDKNKNTLTATQENTIQAIKHNSVDFFEIGDVPMDFNPVIPLIKEQGIMRRFCDWFKSIKFIKKLIRNPYRKVYFHLHSNYKWGGGGWQSLKDKLVFNNEVCLLFKLRGWEIHEPRNAHGCREAVKGMSRLYLFPLEVAGEIEKNLITEVKDILSQGKSFSHYETNVGEALADMSDEKYMEYFKKKEKVIKRILSKGQREFKIASFIISIRRMSLFEICDKYKINRIQERDSSNMDMETYFLFNLDEYIYNLN
jgi:hypothetical protein